MERWRLPRARGSATCSASQRRTPSRVARRRSLTKITPAWRKCGSTVGVNFTTILTQVLKAVFLYFAASPFYSTFSVFFLLVCSTCFHFYCFHWVSFFWYQKGYLVCGARFTFAYLSTLHLCFMLSTFSVLRSEIAHRCDYVSYKCMVITFTMTVY